MFYNFIKDNHHIDYKFKISLYYDINLNNKKCTPKLIERNSFYNNHKITRTFKIFSRRRTHFTICSDNAIHHLTMSLCVKTQLNHSSLLACHINKMSATVLHQVTAVYTRQTSRNGLNI